MIIENKTNFAKLNALGNQIIVLDIGDKHKFDKVFDSFIDNKNIYFEQIMVIYKNTLSFSDFELYIYNNDGSPAGACGNGMRALMQYVYYKYNKKQASFITNSKRKLFGEYINDEQILVNMGKPCFDSKALGLTKILENTENVYLDKDLPMASLVSVGNPHAIFFLPQMPSLDWIKRKGEILEHNNLFKDRCNITFATVTQPDNIMIRTWERGAGLTKACGSAACATHIAAFNKNLTKKETKIELIGGNLIINWQPGYDIIMLGASKVEFFGKICLNSGDIVYEQKI